MIKCVTGRFRKLVVLTPAASDFPFLQAVVLLIIVWHELRDTNMFELHTIIFLVSQYVKQDPNYPKATIICILSPKHHDIYEVQHN